MSDYCSDITWKILFPRHFCKTALLSACQFPIHSMKTPIIAELPVVPVIRVMLCWGPSILAHQINPSVDESVDYSLVDGFSQDRFSVCQLLN